MKSKISSVARKLYVLNHPDRSKYNFIHINKCGGTSVYSSLGQRYKLHDLALERKIHLKEKWNKSFNFSVVRNPYPKCRNNLHNCINISCISNYLYGGTP